MNLSFLSTEPSTTNRDQIYSLVLHQFGHAFGLAHEWDPTWGDLKPDTGMKKSFTQHTASYRAYATSNFPNPDQGSIMKCVQYPLGGSFLIP